MKYLDQIINWIKDQVKKANCSGVAVGISGGIDSALVAYLAKKAFPNDSIGILIPINKKRQFDLEHGLELVKKLDLDYKVIDLSHEYQSMIDKMNVQLDLTKGNMQARLRMTTIYAFAQERKYLVLGTDNKAEYDLGYFTKWGDGGCDLLPIVNLYKSEVFEYAKKVGIPINIINKTPSAGLWDDQSDEKELGFTYDDYEQYDKNLLTDQQLIEKIKLQISKTNHKRIEIPKAPKRSE